MIKYFINAISQGLAFSKAEAKGTFVLIIIIILSITSFRLISGRLKSSESDEPDHAELAEWVMEVESSYSEKKLAIKEVPVQLESVVLKSMITASSARKKNPTKNDKEERIIHDLNSSSASELQKIKGIGKVYSERIVKYRQMLGGFTHIDQLNEVYGLTNELVEKIGERFEVQSSVEKLNINSDSVKILVKHPYISYDLAWIIINYRKQNGDINTFEDLKNIKALDDSVLLKLRPYIE